MSEATDAEGSTGRRVRMRERFGSLAAALVVLFIGVSAAFLLDRYQDARAEDRRRVQVRAALVNEWRELSRELRGLERSLDSTMIGPFVAAEARGEMPALTPLRLGGGGPGEFWPSLMQAGGLDVLDPAFVRMVEEQQGWNRFVSLQADRITRLSDEMLLPNVGEPASHFYDPATRRLRPRYRWYPEELTRFRRFVGATRAITDSLVDVMGHAARR